jgi:hypothetical protein
MLEHTVSVMSEETSIHKYTKKMDRNATDRRSANFVQRSFHQLSLLVPTLFFNVDEGLFSTKMYFISIIAGCHSKYSLVYMSTATTLENLPRIDSASHRRRYRCLAKPLQTHWNSLCRDSAYSNVIIGRVEDF